MIEPVNPSTLRRGNEGRHRRVPEEALIAKTIAYDDRPRAMYDLGVGCFAEWETLKKCWPDMEVFGCEPDPFWHGQLVPIFNGKLLQVAIGKARGRADLYVSRPDQCGSTLLPAQSERSRHTVDAEVWTLDDFDAWAGKPDRVLLWMDIEGSEIDAIEGGRELLTSGRVWYINAETRDGRVEHHFTTQELNDVLSEFGFYPIHRYNVQGSYEGAAGDVIYFRRGQEPLIREKMNWGKQIN